MRNNLKIPKELRKKIDREIQLDEFIKWIEQPIPQFFTLHSTILFVFGIAWSSFVIFFFAIWTFSVWQSSKTLNFKYFDPELRIFLIIFLIMTLSFLFLGFKLLSAPLREREVGRKTAYIVTNKRAISISSTQKGHLTIIQSYFPHHLKNLYREEKANGTGNIIIPTRQWKNGELSSNNEKSGFMRVRNLRETEKVLQELAKIYI
ncbi:MAG: hypothetical protein RLZZ69_13 [Cyanobacteriota bacterium]